MRAKRKKFWEMYFLKDVDNIHAFLHMPVFSDSVAGIILCQVDYLWALNSFQQFYDLFFAKNVRLLGGHVGGGNRVWGFGHRSNKYLLGWFIPLSLTLMMQSRLGQSLIAELMNWLNADQLSVITNGDKFNIDSLNV